MGRGDVCGFRFAAAHPQAFWSMTPRELSAAIGPWPLCLIPPRARRSTR
ncbi:phage tail assembly chaperone [Brucella abortus]|nr:phage tail assembly chaperone [Brucella abortus]